MTRQQALRWILGALGAVLLVFVYFVFERFAAQPGKLVIYLAAGAFTALIITYVIRPRAKFSKCPDCGRSVMIKDTVIFPGGISTEGQELSAIVERRYLCQSCNFRTYKVHELDPKKIDSDALEKAKHKETEISLEQYQLILEEAQKEAQAKNEKPKNTGSEWMF